MSDIHGCFDEFSAFLEQLGFSGGDRLILAGDYIDRGPKSLEMLRWLETRPENVTALLGNHDAEYAAYIALMRELDETEELDTDPRSPADAAALYQTVKYVLGKRSPKEARFFDLYGTVGALLRDAQADLAQLSAWAELLRALPLYVSFPVGDRRCVVVHAGYRESGFADEAERENFCLYARDDAYREGGVPHGIVVAGHTPTVMKDTFSYQNGWVFRYQDTAKDCIYYDIDCGCAYRAYYPSAHLACLCVEDGRITVEYLKQYE